MYCLEKDLSDWVMSIVVLRIQTIPNHTVVLRVSSVFKGSMVGLDSVITHQMHDMLLSTEWWQGSRLHVSQEVMQGGGSVSQSGDNETEVQEL